MNSNQIITIIYPIRNTFFRTEPISLQTESEFFFINRTRNKNLFHTSLLTTDDGKHHISGTKGEPAIITGFQKTRFFI